MSTYAEGMGIATGIAFDREENLYVGDRSGTIFKIARDRQIFVLPLSNQAYPRITSRSVHTATCSSAGPALRVSTPCTESIPTERYQPSTEGWAVRKGWLLMWTVTSMSLPRSAGNAAS